MILYLNYATKFNFKTQNATQKKASNTRDKNEEMFQAKRSVFHSRSACTHTHTERAPYLCSSRPAVFFTSHPCLYRPPFAALFPPQAIVQVPRSLFPFTNIASCLCFACTTGNVADFVCWGSLGVWEFVFDAIYNPGYASCYTRLSIYKHGEALTSLLLNQYSAIAAEFTPTPNPPLARVHCLRGRTILTSCKCKNIVDWRFIYLYELSFGLVIVIQNVSTHNNRVGLKI